MAIDQELGEPTGPYSPSSTRPSQLGSTGDKSSTQAHWTDRARVFIAQDHALQQYLDHQVASEEARHLAAIAQARAEHDRIRRNAEIARERVELEIERERKRRDANELARLEAARQMQVRFEAEERARLQQQAHEDQQRSHQVEEEQRRIARAREEEHANARAKEDARIQAEKQRQVAEAEASRDQRSKDEETARAKEKARIEVENAAQTRAGQGRQAEPQTLETTQLPKRSLAERETQHHRYLQLHHNLKAMREQVVTECKKIPALKNRLGDWRRQITKCLGQLTQDKGRNRKPMSDIMGALKESLEFSQPAIDVSSYLISTSTPDGPVLAPGPLIYLLNIMSKAVIAQFIGECSGGAKAADPVGVVACTIFAMPAFHIQQRPMVDILLAKMHKTCPVLFGISGDEKTVPGRKRLGWWQEDGRFINAERHKERMTGLGAGFAALTLRDFSKSRNDNPLPNTHYWTAFARIVNTPPESVQPTHFIVLRALILGFVPRFIAFYGTAALASLRCALIDFPDRAPATCKGAATQLAVTRELLYNDIRLALP